MEGGFGAIKGLGMVALAIFVAVSLAWGDGDSEKRKPVHETRMSAVERIEYEDWQSDQAKDDLACGEPVNASGC